jgi:hypothetical protein
MRHWFDAVYIWQSDSPFRRTITSVEEAAEWLLERWPLEAQGRRAHLAARTACRAALEGAGTVEAARESFIRAAREAGILAGVW